MKQAFLAEMFLMYILHFLLHEGVSNNQIPTTLLAATDFHTFLCKQSTLCIQTFNPN